MDRMHQRLDELVFRLGFRLGAADHREDAGHDQQFVAAPPVLGQPALDVGIEFLRVGERLVGGEDHLGGSGGERAAGLGSAGLHHDRTALRRARHVERPGDREELALVIDAWTLSGSTKTPLSLSRINASSS